MAAIDCKDLQAHMGVSKIRGPDVGPKQYGSYYKDTHQKEPKCIETAISYPLKGTLFWEYDPEPKQGYPKLGVSYEPARK